MSSACMPSDPPWPNHIIWPTTKRKRDKKFSFASFVESSETGKSRLRLQMFFNGDKVDFNTERFLLLIYQSSGFLTAR